MRKNIVLTSILLLVGFFLSVFVIGCGGGGGGTGGGDNPPTYSPTTSPTASESPSPTASPSFSPTPSIDVSIYVEEGGQAQEGITVRLYDSQEEYTRSSYIESVTNENGRCIFKDLPKGLVAFIQAIGVGSRMITVSEETNLVLISESASLIVNVRDENYTLLEDVDVILAKKMVDGSWIRVQSYKTNEKGNAFFADLDEGVYKIHVGKIGYYGQSFEIYLPDGSLEKHYFYLEIEPQPSPSPSVSPSPSPSISPSPSPSISPSPSPSVSPSPSPSITPSPSPSPSSTITPPSYYGAYLWEKNGDVALGEGQARLFEVKFINTGKTMVRGQVHLGPANPYDRVPGFLREGGDPTGWVDVNGHPRINLVESSVDYGEIATFRFWMKVPNGMEHKTYTEYFRLVSTSNEWFGPSTYWQITVQ